MKPGARRAGIAGAGLLSSLLGWLAARRATRKAPVLVAHLHRANGGSYAVAADQVASAYLSFEPARQAWDLHIHTVGGTVTELRVDLEEGERFVRAWKASR